MNEQKIAVTLDPDANQATQRRYAAFFFLYFGYTMEDILKMLHRTYGDRAINEHQIQSAILTELDRYQLENKPIA